MISSKSVRKAQKLEMAYLAVGGDAAVSTTSSDPSAFSCDPFAMLGAAITVLDMAVAVDVC